MSKLISEIGADSSQFRTDLNSLVQTATASFKQMETVVAKYSTAADTAATSTGKGSALMGEFVKAALGYQGINFAKGVLNDADAIDQFAGNLNIGTDEMQGFVFAVKQANGTQEDANKILTTARVKLDELAAGEKEATKSFAALGLSAKDFIGLTLDQSLEKISRAYVENSTQAGALAGLQDVVGKGGRNLTNVLAELGTNGFGVLVQKAEEAHQVMDAKTIKDLATTADKFEELTDSAKILAGQGLGLVQGAVSHLAGGFAEYVTQMEQADGWWEKLKVGAGSLVTVLKGASEETKKYAAEQEAAAKASAERTAQEMADKAKLAGFVAKIKEDDKKTAKEQHELAEKTNAVHLAALEPIARQAELKKQIAEIEKQLAAGALENKEAENIRKELVARTVELKKTENEIVKQAQDLAKKSALDQEDLLRMMELQKKAKAGLTDVERAELSLLELQSKEKRLHVELSTLLEKHIIGTITPAETKRLNELIKQEKALDKQIGQKTALIQATEAQRAAEAGVTAEIDQQLAALNAINKAKNASLSGIADMQVTAAHGMFLPPAMSSAEIASTSDAALRGVISKREKLLADLAAADAADAAGALSRGVTGDPAGMIMRARINMEIDAIREELRLRGSVRNTIENVGEDRAARIYGDDAVSRASRDMRDATVESLTVLERINWKLEQLFPG
jgi:hypothetical protein